MMRFIVLAGAAGILFATPACSSLNPFGGSEPKQAAASGTTAGEPAKRTRPRESERLVRFDANGDGVVSTAELEETLKADFAKEDANGDEVLDVAEMRTLNDRLRDEKIASPVFDWNADGQLVFTEYASQWRTLFQRADIDRDGIVDEEELTGKARERKPRELPKPTFSGKDGRPPGSP